MSQKDFIFEIKPHDSFFKLNYREIWRYRDLLMMFVRRDIVAQYKQTILGPLWFLIQPVLTSVVMLVVFGNIAGLSTDGMPKLLFYLAGNTAWSYFATCLKSTSNSFTANASIFGKVYFPRLVSPLSTVISNLVKFCIQFLIFISFYFYFYFTGTVELFSWSVLILPVLIILMGGIGLGIGTTISSLTTKYRDLTYLVEFGVQLMMYLTPVIISMSTFESKLGKYAYIVKLNPMTGIIETFRNVFIGTGAVEWTLLAYSAGVMVVMLLIGTVIFNNTEKNFMDTV